MNAFFYPSKRGINFAKIRGFKVTDYKPQASGQTTSGYSESFLGPSGRKKAHSGHFTHLWSYRFSILVHGLVYGSTEMLTQP